MTVGHILKYLVCFKIYSQTNIENPIFIHPNMNSDCEY